MDGGGDETLRHGAARWSHALTAVCHLFMQCCGLVHRRRVRVSYVSFYCGTVVAGSWKCNLCLSGSCCCFLGALIPPVLNQTENRSFVPWVCQGTWGLEYSEVFLEMFPCVYLLFWVTLIRLEITYRGTGLMCGYVYVCVWGGSIYCLRYLYQFKPVDITLLLGVFIFELWHRKENYFLEMNFYGVCQITDSYGG